MKKKIAEIILPVFITLILTFIFQYFGELLTQPKGVYDISYISINNDKIAILSLDNKTDKIHDGLVYSISKSNNLLIDSESFIDYKFSISKSNSTNILLTLDNILPDTKSKLIIKGLTKDSEILFSNCKDKKYNLESDLVNSQLNALRNAIINTLIYGLIYGLFYIYYMYKFNQNVEKLEKETSEINERIKELESKVEKYKKSYLKYKILLMKKVRDYEKELNFWKTIASKILVEDKLIKPKELFKTITEKLKTFGTRDFNDDELTMAEYINKETEE